MKTIKWYVHGSDNYGSIREWLDDDVEEMALPENIKEALVENLRGKFYEVAFDVQFDEHTGEIMKVTPTNL